MIISTPAKPWSRAEFHQRLQSFRLAWFPQSSGVQFNPVFAAACGWQFQIQPTTAKQQMLHCLSCSTTVPLLAGGSLVDLSMDRLQSLHAVQCPWRKLVCSLPTVYACPARTKTAALEYLTERLDRLMEIQDQLPHIANESTAENNDDIIALLPETRRAVQADAMTLSKLLPLIINGWTVAAVHEDFDRRHVSVQCEYCYRTVLLNYSSAQFDPLRQHRWFCLAQHAYEQCDRRTLSQQLRAALFSTPLQSIESFRKPADAVHFVQDLLLRPHLMLHK